MRLNPPGIFRCVGPGASRLPWPGGMARAIRETGTDEIGYIVRNYTGPAFGFASRNFYAEFLAAADQH